jgi:hypothetical protein
MQKSIASFIFLFCVLCASSLIAQPGPPIPGGPPCGGPFGGPACPIDGGVSLLIAAGVAYGGKKSYDLSRKGQ